MKRFKKKADSHDSAFDETKEEKKEKEIKVDVQTKSDKRKAALIKLSQLHQKKNG